MDLFEVLVRLEAAGWRTEPPKAEVSSDNPELQRLLRKLSALSRDGRRLEFGGIEAEPPVKTRSALRCLEANESGSVWLLEDGPVRIFEFVKDSVQAFELVSYLRQLFDPQPVEELVPQPLADLGFDGDGWGWDLSEVHGAMNLSPELLPLDLREAELQLDARCLWAGDRVEVVIPPTPQAVQQTTSAMPAELGELFGEGWGHPTPRTRLIGGLLISGVVLTFFGMACIAAPGGLLVLLAWMYVEKDMERLESGYLPEADRPRVELLRNLTYGGLLFVILMFVIQGLLLCNGGYDYLLDTVYIPAWQAFIRSLLQVPDPASALLG